MKKTVKTSNEERIILKRLSTEQLSFLSSLRQNQDFSTFLEIIDMVIDLEKNSFFGENESMYENPVWQARHAYARGGVAKLIMITRLIAAAEEELGRREEERKKRHVQ